MDNLNLAETREINSSGSPEHIDVTVSWRRRDYAMLPAPGEGIGGIAKTLQGDRLAVVNGGNLNGREFTAAIMAQEVGHTLGLEPVGSPHYQDPLDHGHSKDPRILDPFAFDFFRLRPYSANTTTFLGDVMNNFGGGVGQGTDSVLYNAYDWEYLRQRLLELQISSTQDLDETRTYSEDQKKLDPNLEEILSDLPKIEIEKSELTLTAKHGFEWRWTSEGFRLLEEAKTPRSGSTLIQSVETILSGLKEIGVKEFYAPVGDKSLNIVINPRTTTDVDAHRFHVVN